ncbi:MAG: hypothetical protein H7315_18665 [Herminiimonas sp.]|nr:hypothetical protein [Herminiimonas sp.]
MTLQLNARVVVSVSEGKIEIEGSELFVAEQLAQLNNVICQIVSSAARFASGESNAVEPRVQHASTQALSFGRYADLYAHRDGRLQLLKELPGSNMAHKTISAALLLSHANLLLGSDSTPLEIIRKACKDHACHDSNNFAATLKREKALFRHSGSSYITLSDAGRTLAESMADQLLAA